MNRILSRLVLTWLVLGLVAALGAACTDDEAGLYHNTTYGFAVTVPEGWVEEETGERQPIVVISAPDTLSLVAISLSALPQETGLAEYASQMTADLSQVYPQFQLVSQREVTLAQATPGYELVYTIAGDGDRLVKGKDVLVLRGTQVFHLSAGGSSADFEGHLDAIDQVIYSFRLEEPAPEGIAPKEALTVFDTGPVTLDPAASRDSTSHLYVMHIFSGLVALDHDLKPVPDIAQRWELDEDGTTYTFYLRRDARFHDGSKVTAGDFKYAWERASDLAISSDTAETYLGDIIGVKEVVSGEATEISGVEVIDDYTLRVKIGAPKVYFLAKLTYPVAYAVDRANIESDPQWWRDPNGSGPFRLKEWKEDEVLILERNEKYYGDLAKLKHVIFRLWGGVPMQMYEMGEIDITSVSIDHIDRVLDETDPLHRELVVVPQLSLQYIGFNAAKPPFDDANIRRAFARAVDKDKVIAQVLKDMVGRADGIIPPALPGHNADLKGLSHDVEAARQLIAASPYGDVSQLPPIIFTTAGWGAAISPVVEAVISEWRTNLGLEVGVRQMEIETYFYQLKEEKNELFDYGWVADYPDPENFLDVLFHSRSQHNVGEYSSPEVDALLEKARVEPVVGERLEMYRQAEERLVNDAALLPLWFDTNYVLVKPYVSGYIPSPQGILNLAGISVEPH
jgi:oligopeptide transport system substrate-binding protein